MRVRSRQRDKLTISAGFVTYVKSGTPRIPLNCHIPEIAVSMVSICYTIGDLESFLKEKGGGCMGIFDHLVLTFLLAGM